MIDIIAPSQKKDSDSFIKMARTLGLTGLCILSNNADAAPATLPFFSLQSPTPSTSNVPLCVTCSPTAVTQRTDILFDVEPLGSKDAARSRNAGLTPALLATLRQKRIALGFSLHHLFSAEQPEQHFGRVAQNIKLARKSRIPVVLGSLASKPQDMRAEREIRALFHQLGLQHDEAKQAVHATEKMIQRNCAAGGKAVPGIDIQNF